MNQSSPHPLITLAMPPNTRSSSLYIKSKSQGFPTSYYHGQSVDFSSGIALAHHDVTGHTRTTVYRTSARKDRSSTTWVSCRDQTKVVEIASHRDSVKVSFAQNATELTAFAATQFRAPLLNVVTASSKITTSSASGRPPKASIKAPVITTTNTIARYRGVEHKEPRLKYDDVFKLEQKAGYSKGHMGHCFHPKERVHWMKEVEALDCGRVLGRDIQGWTFVPWGLF